MQRAGGSGFVIKGKRIMTNAHVVTWGRQILVRRYQDASGRERSALAVHARDLVEVQDGAHRVTPSVGAVLEAARQVHVAHVFPARVPVADVEHPFVGRQRQAGGTAPAVRGRAVGQRYGEAG